MYIEVNNDLSSFSVQTSEKLYIDITENCCMLIEKI